MRKHRLQTRGLMGDINMVPFIDITLILLIIFIVNEFAVHYSMEKHKLCTSYGV